MAPFLVLSSPLLLETNNQVWAEPLGLVSQERLLGLRKISGRISFEVEPKNELFDGLAAAQEWRQDRRANCTRSALHSELSCTHTSRTSKAPAPVTMRRAGRCRNQTLALGVPVVLMHLEERANLGFKGLLKHPLSALADDLSSPGKEAASRAI